MITNGDFLQGESNEQHIEHLLLANKGQYKNAPTAGVGVAMLRNAPLSLQRRSAMQRDIKLQLILEGLQNAIVKISADGVINISSQ